MDLWEGHSMEGLYPSRDHRVLLLLVHTTCLNERRRTSSEVSLSEMKLAHSNLLSIWQVVIPTDSKKLQTKNSPQGSPISWNKQPSQSLHDNVISYTSRLASYRLISLASRRPHFEAHSRRSSITDRTLI